MHKSRLIVLAVAVVATVVLVGGLVLVSGRSEHKASRASVDPALVSANSFPVPQGAGVAFPDAVTATSVSKGWRARGALEQACAEWRNAYRGWVDQAASTSLGTLTGDDQDGRRCSFSATKDGRKTELALTVYGTDPTPNVTLTIYK